MRNDPFGQVYSVERLLYLDPDFVSAAYEEITGESPATDQSGGWQGGHQRVFHLCWRAHADYPYFQHISATNAAQDRGRATGALCVVRSRDICKL